MLIVPIGLMSSAAPSGPTELNVTYSVTSTYSTYSGHTGTGSGLRDGANTAANTVWANAAHGADTITAILGSSKFVDHVDLLPIPASFDGWGSSYLNGKGIEYTNDGTNWTFMHTISGLTDGGGPVSYSIGANATHVRLFTFSWLGVGDFRIYIL